MTIYVDPLMSWGWKMRGRTVQNCHLITDGNLDELHQFAAGIGLKRAWFQDKPGRPHYDLTPVRRIHAVAAGAVEVDRRQAVTILRARRERVES